MKREKEMLRADSQTLGGTWTFDNERNEEEKDIILFLFFSFFFSSFLLFINSTVVDVSWNANFNLSHSMMRNLSGHAGSMADVGAMFCYFSLTIFIMIFCGEVPHFS